MHCRTRTRHFILIPSLTVFLFVITLPGFCENRSQTNSTEHIVLIIIDGLHHSEGLGNPDHVYSSNMWRPAQQSTVIELFSNNGITYTSRGNPCNLVRRLDGCAQFQRSLLRRPGQQRQNQLETSNMSATQQILLLKQACKKFIL